MTVKQASTIASIIFLMIMIMIIALGFFAGWRVSSTIFACTFGSCFIYLVLTVFVFRICKRFK